MSSLRDFLRDFIGIFFPGGFMLAIFIWFVINVALVLSPVYSVLQYTNWFVYSILIILSYVIGQLFRMKQLVDVEKKWTESDRKATKKEYVRENKGKKNFKELENTGFIKGYENLEDMYSKAKSISDMENLRKEFVNHHHVYQLWEEFPYPYYLKFWRIARHPKKYALFYKKYDDQGITNEKEFFHLCKNVIYEYSPSFKEELLRQESLIRLFSGIFHSARFAKWVIGIIAVEHIALILFDKLGYQIPGKFTFETLVLIFIVNLLLLVGLGYLYSEIVRKIRYMRVKELQICYDSFYIICKKHKLNY